MKIEVKQQHIDAGYKAGAFTCPIALAMNDATKSKWCVGPWEAVHVPTDTVHKLPPQAQKFVHDFDDRKDVSPFSFEFDWNP